MNFLKKYFWQLLAALLLVFIIGIVVKIINSNPVVIKDDTERKYLLEKIKQDSLDLEDIKVNYIRFKELAEAKQKTVIKYKTIYIEKQDSVALLDSIHSLEYFSEWTKQPVIHY